MKINDYAFLSDCQSAALVNRNGSIDWFCLPRFDSPSIFARLLDRDAGHWRLSPAGDCQSERAYVQDTLVLKNVFSTAQGKAEVIEALAFEPGSRGHEIGRRVPHALLRLVRGLEGTVKMQMEFKPRFDYGRIRPNIGLMDGGLALNGGGMDLQLWAPAWVDLEVSGDDVVASFKIDADEVAGFVLGTSSPGKKTGAPPVTDIEKALEETVEGWQSLHSMHEAYQGLYKDRVHQSAVILQGLTYQPTGAVVAAATTSLPEVLGGEANWDYRYSWLRDASLMMRALWVAACPDEPERFFDWINKASARDGWEAFQIMYGVEGERELTEQVLDLRGFAGSRPVRIGNDAWRQKQLDVLGEVLDAAYVLRERLGELSEPVRDLLITYADHAAVAWHEPDAGIWEARDAQRHYTFSKVMCWVALDRAVRMADMLRAKEKKERWKKACEEVRETILTQAWNSKVGAYTGAFGSDELDAAVLLMPLVDFLPATDERMLLTIEAIDREFCSRGLVRRWQQEQNGFIICSYWLVECMAMAGRKDRAREIFELVTALANDVGLLSEMADLKTGDLLGNFPQAFSHVGLINAAWRLTLAFQDGDTPVPPGAGAGTIAPS